MCDCLCVCVYIYFFYCNQHISDTEDRSNDTEHPSIHPCSGQIHPSITLCCNVLYSTDIYE